MIILEKTGIMKSFVLIFQLEIWPDSVHFLFHDAEKYSVYPPRCLMTGYFILNRTFLTEELHKSYCVRAKEVYCFLTALHDRSPEKSCYLNLTVLVDTDSDSMILILLMISFSFNLMGLGRITIIVGSI